MFNLFVGLIVIGEDLLLSPLGGLFSKTIEQWLGAFNSVSLLSLVFT